MESTVVPTYPEICKMKIKRTCNDSLLSDAQSILSDISVMKELPSSQSQVVLEKKEKYKETEKALEETREMRSSSSVAAHVNTDYFVAGQVLYSGSEVNKNSRSWEFST